jgi:hypothetical protein
LKVPKKLDLMIIKANIPTVENIDDVDASELVEEPLGCTEESRSPLLEQNLPVRLISELEDNAGVQGTAERDPDAGNISDERLTKLSDLIVLGNSKPRHNEPFF